MSDAAVDGTMVDDMIEDDVTVHNPAAASKRRRWFLWQHIRGGEAEARGVKSPKQEGDD